jgi:hypothetical protein
VAATIWNQVVPGGVSGGAQSPFTLGTQFTLSRTCFLQGVWWYSYPSATVLPVMCGVWDIGSQAAVTEDGAPHWVTKPGSSDAAAGSGWVFCDFTAAGVTLADGGNYVAAVFQPASGVAWWCTIAGYWSTGAGGGGILNGPLFAPPAGASVNGQGCYDTSGTWVFPGTNPGNGEVFYVDVQVYG